MNKRTPLVVAAIAAVATAPTTAAAQGKFEGVVTFQVKGGRGGREGTMKYSVKGDKVRMDISGQGMEMYTLFDASTKTADMVIPMRQMYMEGSMDAVGSAQDTTPDKSKFAWTGKKESIAGHQCEHATVTANDGKKTDLCLARDMGRFVSMGARGGRGRGPGMAAWQDQIGPAFPLQVTDPDGTVELLATKIEKKSIDDSLFTIPKGYSKMAMPGGGRSRRR